MKRFAKIILALVAGIAAVLLLILIGINLYLQSGDVQQRIRLATEQALGMPVTVKRTIFTPWGGLTLSGLSLPDPTVPGATLVDAPTFSVQFEFFSLLSRKFIITSVSLTDPHLSLRQTEDRKWVLLPARPARPGPTRPTVENPPAAPLPGPVEPTVRPPAFTVELQEFHISGGHADIIDRKGRMIARVDGLIVDGKIDSSRRVEGDLWIDSIEIADQLYPNRLRAHFVQEGERLAVTDAKCAIADGKVRAEFHLVTPRRSAPEFHLKTEVEGVSIPTLIAEAQGNKAGTSGSLLGHFELRGNPLEPKTFTGRGEFSLDAAQLRPLDFIQQIGMILRIDELQMLDLRRAQMNFEVRDEKVLLNDITLQTDNVIINGKGPIRFDGKMNLAGRLMLNEKLQKQLGGLIGDNFTPSEDANYKQVTFTVNGKLDRPKTNLIDKITGIPLGNMSGILRGLFGAPAPASPSPTPVPTAE